MTTAFLLDLPGAAEGLGLAATGEARYASPVDFGTDADLSSAAAANAGVAVTAGVGAKAAAIAADGATSKQTHDRRPATVMARGWSSAPREVLGRM